MLGAVRAVRRAGIAALAGARGDAADGTIATSPAPNVFRPPLLRVTLVGIVLATVPMIGGWGTANWMIPWAEEVAGSRRPSEGRRAARLASLTGIVGSLLGGWIASVVGPAAGPTSSSASRRC